MNNEFKKFVLIIFLLTFLISGCDNVTADPVSNNGIDIRSDKSISCLPDNSLILKVDCEYPWLPEKYDVKRRVSSIPCPEEFNRIPLKKDSFQYWLRHIPMKKDGTSVKLHNGKLKNNQDVHFSVLDIDTGKKNLQQCADAVMRLSVQYLYSQ